MTEINKIPKVIALDFEGTLVSNAVSLILRPGLYEFLEFCKANYSRIVMFTVVSKKRLYYCIDLLIQNKEIPDWFSQIEYIDWAYKPESNFGQFKDLRCIPDANVEEIIIIEDMPDMIVKKQIEQYIQISSFDYRNPENDTELKRIENILKTKK